jgi:hypothetical protein
MSKEELRRGTREMVQYLLDEVVMDDNDIVDGYTDAFMTGFEEYHEKSLVEFLNSIRDYMHESRNTLLNDERTSEEFVKIFLENQNKDK